MTAILEAVVPLFTLVIVGFATGWTRRIDPDGVKALVAFVFHIALPPLLFRLVVNSDITAVLEPAFLAAYVIVQLTVAVLGAAIARVLLALDPAALVIQGFGSSFSNSVLLGIPLMIALFGQDGALSVTMIFGANVVFYSTVTLLLMLTRRGQTAVSVAALAAGTAKAVLRNPIILAAVGGMLIGGAGFTLPPVLDRTLGFIGQAGPAIALFALGASLGVRQMATSQRGPPLRAAVLMSVCKLALHPMLVWTAVVLVFDLDPFLAKAAVIIAALPVGANVYIFAQHYEVGVEQVSGGILISTAFSMVTLPIWLWLVL